MKKHFKLLTVLLFFAIGTVHAQDEASTESPLTFSGSADVYYKYDFSGQGNVQTSFADEQNSFSIGMLNLIAEKSWGNTSFVGDLSFGPRSTASIPGNFNIQNLFIAHRLTEAITVTAGYMGTFVGYEVISPTANFNYSTSYLFTNGPFQNAGVKADFSLSDKFAVMVGLFNDWNLYQDPTSSKDIGLQFAITPSEAVAIYLNLSSGEQSGTIYDLTAGFALSEKFNLGINAAIYGEAKEPSLFSQDSDNGYVGTALYGDYTISEKVALGIRYENFTFRTTGDTNNINAITLTSQIGKGSVKFIPEIRFDSAGEDIFKDSDGASTGSAIQFSLAAVASF